MMRFWTALFLMVQNMLVLFEGMVSFFWHETLNVVYIWKPFRRCFITSTRSRQADDFFSLCCISSGIERCLFEKFPPQKAISHTRFSSKRKVRWSLWAEKLIYHHCGLEMQARWNKVLTRPRTLCTRTSLFAVHWFRKTCKAWERKI